MAARTSNRILIGFRRDCGAASSPFNSVTYLPKASCLITSQALVARQIDLALLSPPRAALDDGLQITLAPLLREQS